MDGVCILPYAYALSFFFGWQVNGQHVVLNLFRVKLMEMSLSWDSLFNHAKGLHHLWRSLPLLQKEMLLRMKKVTVLKRILSSVLGNVSFCSFVTSITTKLPIMVCLLLLLLSRISLLEGVRFSWMRIYLFTYMLAASPRKKPASPPRKRSSPNRRVESPRRPPDPSPRRRPDSPPIRRRPDPSPVRRGDTPPRRRPLSPLRRRSPSPPRRHMR